MDSVICNPLTGENFSGVPDLGNTLLWKNSSNVLCKYLKEQIFLDSILEKLAIVPRYVVEPLDYLKLGDINKICFPMTCFCDIPFSKVSTHMSHYGRYGIGLDKKSVIKKYRIQPIHYINDDSPLADDFKEAFLTSLKGTITEKEEILANYIASTLMYMKPIWWIEQDENGNSREYVYQDECEWRYIPSDHFPTELHLILKQHEMTKKGIKTYNEVLEKHPECWLKFEWSEVRYIIVPDEAAVKHTISVINGIEEITDLQREMLISKIEISKHFSEDM